MQIMNDIDYVYSSYYNNSLSTTEIILICVGVLIALTILCGFAISKLLKILGYNSWHANVPIINTWDLFVSLGRKGWSSLIPCFNVIVLVESMYKFPQLFGKSKLFSVINIFIPYITLPLLAFLKKKEAKGSNNAPVNPVDMTVPVIPNVPVQTVNPEQTASVIPQENQVQQAAVATSDSQA